MPESRSANILIQTAFLGDLLLSIPLIKKIKELWPEQKLVLVCRKGVGDFFLKTELVDQVFEIKKGDGKSYSDILKAVARMEIENIISPHESFRTALFVSKLKAKRKISFSRFWNGIFFGQRIKKNYELPDAVRQLSLLQNFDEKLKAQIEKYFSENNFYKMDKAGKLSSPPNWASMSLKDMYRHREKEVEKVLQRLELAKQKKTVALFPGSVWATKRWTEEGYIQVGQELSNRGLQVLVMGGPGEEELCARVAQKIPGARDLCAKTTIYESALLLSTVDAVVGNDSASMHLAATSETPSVVIFGPTILEFGFRPWQDQVYVVEKKDITCRPCGKHGHKECPLNTHACMKEIGKNEVMQKLHGALYEI